MKRYDRMRRRFNITGSCSPQRHYMVRLDDRLKAIRENYVDEGSYFVINRGRQYGKTTTLNALEDVEDQTVTLPRTASDGGAYGLKELFIDLSKMCGNSPRPVVLMIDEVDSAGNNQVFIDFLAQLRGYYLKRDKRPIFHSVILAGVYNINNLKLKLRPESEHQYNSPWNMAADFKINMSFSVEQIASMLNEYETEHCTGMDVRSVAEEIYQYTSGYPVLVSSICKYIDEDIVADARDVQLSRAWSEEGVACAVKRILKDNPPLFESMAKQLDTYKDLHNIIEDIIYRGKRIPFSMEERSIHLGVMFGYLKEENDRVVIANRIFEMCLLNMFMAKEAITSEVFAKGGSDKPQAQIVAKNFKRYGIYELEFWRI